MEAGRPPRLLDFEACSTFTRVTARMFAEPPMAARLSEVLQAMSLPPRPASAATGWNDSCRTGFAPAGKRRLSTAHSMHKLHDVLRLKFELGRSHREIATSLGIGHAAVSRYVRRAEEVGLSWPLPENFGDRELKASLFAPVSAGASRPVPDSAEVHREMSRGKGTTLELLWLEYREAHPEDGYEYSWFCARYREWAKRVDVVMRHSYAGGERVFIDYAGRRSRQSIQRRARSARRTCSWRRWLRRVIRSWT